MVRRGPEERFTIVSGSISVLAAERWSRHRSDSREFQLSLAAGPSHTNSTCIYAHVRRGLHCGCICFARHGLVVHDDGRPGRATSIAARRFAGP
eukprot:7384507-Pyramimonas_sp.AAC.1